MEQESEFATAYLSFLKWVHDDARGGHNEVAGLVAGFLGPDRIRESVVTREWSAFERVNLQTALNAWIAGKERSVVCTASRCHHVMAGCTAATCSTW